MPIPHGSLTVGNPKRCAGYWVCVISVTASIQHVPHDNRNPNKDNGDPNIESQGQQTAHVCGGSNLMDKPGDPHLRRKACDCNDYACNSPPADRPSQRRRQVLQRSN
jgi:hypothetical protein